MNYGCHNQPRPTSAHSYPAQDGWFYDESGMTRKPQIVQIHHVMTTDCQYSQTTVDAGCAGCQHNQGETNGKSN